MKFISPLIFIFCLNGCVKVLTDLDSRRLKQQTAHSKIEIPLGINLSQYSWGATQIPFVDAFDRARGWESFDASTGAATAAVIPLGRDGYPLQIPAGSPASVVRSRTLGGISGRYPAGSYTLFYAGAGQLEVQGDIVGGPLTCDNGGPCSFSVAPSNAGIHIYILQSQAANPVHNIRLILPGHAGNYQARPFYPPLVDPIKNRFSVLRAMNLNRTNLHFCDNGRAIRDFDCETWWEERILSDQHVQISNKGMAYEKIVAFNNEVNADLWINIPHAARMQDPALPGERANYVRELAKLIKRDLAPHLNVYVEYSNEVWNAAFAAWTYARDNGLALGLSAQSEEARNLFYVSRSIRVFEIFKEVFGVESHRVKTVIAGHSANAGRTNSILSGLSDLRVNPRQFKIDYFAIGPYIGAVIGRDILDEIQAGTLTQIPPIHDPGGGDDIMGRLRAYLPWLESRLRAQRNAVDQAGNALGYSIDLIAYEGGQHMEVPASHRSLPQAGTLINVLADANRHPLMKDIYRDLLNLWYAESGGGLFVNFNYLQSYGVWGYWGALEWTGQAVDCPDFDPLDALRLGSGCKMEVLWERSAQLLGR